MRHRLLNFCDDVIGGPLDVVNKDARKDVFSLILNPFLVRTTKTRLRNLTFLAQCVF